jgi:hypothetical protein
MLGLYAVMAYSVIERHREFALRIALSSTRAAVFRLVLSGSAWTAVVGLVTGGLGSIAAVRLLRSMLFGVAPSIPASYCVAAALLLMTVFLSGVSPARPPHRSNPCRRFARSDNWPIQAVAAHRAPEENSSTLQSPFTQAASTEARLVPFDEEPVWWSFCLFPS